MDASALPYLLYFFSKIVFIIAYGVIGHIQRRLLMAYVIAWLVAGAIRYALIVLSAGDVPMMERDEIIWFIRLLVYVENALFVAASLVFVSENVTLRKKKETQ